MGSAATQIHFRRIGLPCKIIDRALDSRDSDFYPAMVLHTVVCSCAARSKSTKYLRSLAETAPPKV